MKCKQKRENTGLEVLECTTQIYKKRFFSKKSKRAKHATNKQCSGQKDKQASKERKHFYLTPFPHPTSRACVAKQSKMTLRA